LCTVEGDDLSAFEIESKSKLFPKMRMLAEDLIRNAGSISASLGLAFKSFSLLYSDRRTAVRSPVLGGVLP
jgi:hypothetical protein